VDAMIRQKLSVLLSSFLLRSRAGPRGVGVRPCVAGQAPPSGVSLRGHNDTPCGRLTPKRPIGCRGVGRPQGVIGGLSYCRLVIFFINIVSLIMDLTLYVFEDDC
jgi:hypothetical protein